MINLWELLISDKSFAFSNVQTNEITLISLGVDDDTDIIGTETDVLDSLLEIEITANEYCTLTHEHSSHFSNKNSFISPLLVLLTYMQHNLL